MFSNVMTLCIPTAPSCCVPLAQSQSVSLISITFTWDREECLSRNGDSSHYVLRYGETGSSNEMMTDNYGLNFRKFISHSLYPSTLYTFEVALVNLVGMGPPTRTDFSTSTPTGKSVTQHMVLAEV